MKLKKCRVCGKDYMPRSSIQKCCSWPCALDYADQQDKRKQKSIARKQKKEFYSTDKKYQLKLAQTAFNAFIRERDKDEPCISCQRHHTGQYHAGHYKTTAAQPGLRFHPFNNNKQCAPCNNHLSGNIFNYRVELIRKIGQKNVDWLDNFSGDYKFTLDDIIEIKNHYKEQLKILQSNGFDKWAEGL